MSKAIDRDDVTEAQWTRFRKVQDGGRFNMLDPLARTAAGLDGPTFLAIVVHYGWLKDKFEGKAKPKK